MTESMHGKTVMVTGATDGIGLVTARELARQGARVLLVGRNEQKGQRAISAIRQAARGADLEFHRCEEGAQGIECVTDWLGSLHYRPEYSNRFMMIGWPNLANDNSGHSGF